MADQGPRIDSPPSGHLDSAVIVLDGDGRIVEWSQAAEVLFGYSRTDVLGRMAVSFLIDDPQRDYFWRCMENSLSTQTPNLKHTLETTCLRHDGTDVLVELTVAPLRLPGQTLLMLHLFDLTTLRTRQQTTSQQIFQSKLFGQTAAISPMDESLEAVLKTCVETICDLTNWPVGHVWLLDPGGKVMRSAGVWHLADDQRLAKFDPTQLPSRYGRGEGVVGQVWVAGEPFWISEGETNRSLCRPELVTLGLEGTGAFPILVDGDVIAILEFFHWEAMNPDTQTLGQIEHFRNQVGHFIEHRQGMEERARLAAIVESSYDAIIARDHNGRIIAWNSGAEQIYGYAAEEILGGTVDIILPPNLEEEEASIRNVLKTGKRLNQFETKRRCKDGTIIDVALTVSPIRDSRGRIVGSSTIERDISTLKKRESELRKAKRAAEKADQAKTEFLANISHELRTPMNAILGMLDLSLGEDLSEVLRDYLSTARESAHILLYLLNDLLDFSRMSAGHLELESEPFRLRETVDAVMKTVALRASEKGLELACQIGKNVPNQLKGDGMRLRQVIVNLANNAIKFTNRGEVLVRVDLLSQSDGEVVLQFSVRDTGIGISPENQSKIFAPFMQVDATTTRTESGSGLGLAIVRELVSKMNGTIGLESELGQGSLFYFSVPLEVLPEQMLPQPNLELANLSVLVVDDNRTNRVILEETLTNWSMRPTVVSSAKAALEAIEQADSAGQPFSLIIVDALMPDVDGFMLVEELGKRKAESGQPMTVLMLSSADRQTFKQRCDNLEVSAFLEKPVSQSELLETLINVLRKPLLDREAYKQVQPIRNGLKILVAEDTPANQKVIRAILHKRGHQTQVANNGREAVDRLKQDRFDLVLMDVQMPTMDGLQATQAIRRLPQRNLAEIPIVAMTAHARREDRQKCLAAGMDAYISKPIDAAKLLQLIESVQHRASVLRPSDTWDGTWPSDDSDNPPQLINLGAAKARMGGDSTLVVDLANFFLEDGPNLLKELEAGLRNRQADNVERAAHSLKGLAANFDAEHLATLSMAIEDHARNEDFSAVRQRLDELKRSLRSVIAELKLYLNLP